MFGFVLGTTSVAWAIVLAAYMGGMALGSFFGGRLADRIANPLKAFAFCEVAIGLFGACSWPIIGVAQQVFSSPSFLTLVPAPLTEIVKITASVLMLSVPTACMGATFPLVSRGILTRNSGNAKAIGLIYSVNTFGAVLGAVSTGFVLLSGLGISLSLFAAASINIVIATILLFAFKQNLPQNPDPDLELEIKTPKTFDDGRMRVFAFVLACTGFCTMAFEVLWARSLVYFLTSTTYAFTAMLSVVLAGLACGAMIATAIGKKTTNGRIWISAFQMFIGIFACITPLLLQHIDPLIHHIETALSHTWFNWVIVRYAVCLGMVFPPALCMGATFPLSMGYAIGSFKDSGKSIGLLLFVNTAASILGALTVTFLFVPSVGTQASFVVIALGNFCAGFFVFGRNKIARSKLFIPTVAVIALLLVVLLLFANKFPMVGFSSAVRMAQRPIRVVSYKEDRAVSVAVLKTDRERILNIDGFNAAGTYRYEYMHLMGHLPVLLAQHPDTALVICLGTGTTCGAVGLHENVLWVDCAEISRAVISSVNVFADVNNNLERNLKIHILCEDGRNHLLRSKRMYDVITLEPMHPYLSSATNLYSADFYALCKKRLSQHGVMAQWAPLHVLSPKEYRMLIHSFTSVFPHASLWFLGTEGILIGTMDSLHLNIDALKMKMAQEGVAKDMATISLAEPARLLSCFVMDERALAAYVDGVGTMTDDRPIIEFTAPRNLALPADRMWLANMEELEKRRVSVLPFIDQGSHFSLAEVVRSGEAASFGMKSEIAFVKQDFSHALALADSALARVSGDTTFKMIRAQAAEGVMTISLNKARWFRRLGNLQEAEKAYLQASAVDSSSAALQTEITTLYTQMELFDLALPHALRATELSPDPELTVNLAVVYMNLNRPSDAQTALRQALRLQSSNKRALYYLKMLDEEKGKTLQL